MDYLSSIDWAETANTTAWVGGGILLTFVALAGVIVSVMGLPGILLTYAAMVVYAFATDFESIGIPSLVIAGIITVLFFFVDNVTVAVGAKMARASKWAALAALVGSIGGLIFFGPLGALIGSLVCVVVIEYYTDPDAKKALRAGIGTFIGYLAGMLARFLLSLILFIWLVVEMV